MASPVDTSVTYTHNKMSGSPVLKAEPGSMIALLDAVLVNGFDTKAGTGITIVGGVATLSFTGVHSAEQETVILISGATGAFSDLNGRQKVVTKSISILTFKTALPDGVATGSLSFMMAPAGWNKVFTATNLAVYKSADPQAGGQLLRVDDTDAVAARVRGYETMSDINTGTGMFPTPAQLFASFNIPLESSGGFWFKGVNASVLPVGWTIFCDTRFFMFGNQVYQTQGVNYSNFVLCHLFGFGDPIVKRPSGDPYATVISFGNSTTTNSSVGGGFSQGEPSYSSVYACRPYNGLGISEFTGVYSYSDVANPNETLSGSTLNKLGRFPSPIDGSISFSQKYLRKYSITNEFEYAPRANIPGLLHIPMSGVFASLSPKTIISGSGIFSNKKLVTVAVGSPNTDNNINPDNAGICLVDLTGPWR